MRTEAIFVMELRCPKWTFGSIVGFESTSSHSNHGHAVCVLLFSGKGVVGKTSFAAATGLRLAGLGYRTLVMSIDSAQSLADSFDLDVELFQVQTSDPFPCTCPALDLNAAKGK
jgi:hypothetical protein